MSKCAIRIFKWSHKIGFWILPLVHKECASKQSKNNPSHFYSLILVELVDWKITLTAIFFSFPMQNTLYFLKCKSTGIGTDKFYSTLYNRWKHFHTNCCFNITTVTCSVYVLHTKNFIGKLLGQKYNLAAPTKSFYSTYH